MKIIFFGSDDFAQAHLEHLLEKGFDIVACVTQTDKARDRGMKVKISPIKESALEHGIDILQPDDLSSKVFVDKLNNYQADLFVVIAYGKFLPSDILKIPKVYSINVHGSYLPKYRGAAPINWAIINGETETGVSIIKINERMDAGDILAQEKVVIAEDDTSATLRIKLIDHGKVLLAETIKNISDISPVAQNEKDATFAPKLTKDLGKIDWSKSAQQIRNMIRGLLPWPTAYTYINGKMLKILNADIAEFSEMNSTPRTVVDINSDGMIVVTGEGALLVKEVHLESSKAMDIHSFLRGHSIEAGFIFA